jgi:hypothetical protein
MSFPLDGVGAKMLPLSRCGNIINALLQWGDRAAGQNQNRFTGFSVG